MMVNLNSEIFAIKLYEMQKQHEALLCRLRLCGQGNHETVRAELQRARDDYDSQSLLLRERAAGSRSPAVAELAQAQLAYIQAATAALNRQAELLSRSGSGAAEAQAEAATLYAEYAIDFAAQAMRYALVCALSALDLQMNAQQAPPAAAENKEECNP